MNNMDNKDSSDENLISRLDKTDKKSILDEMISETPNKKNCDIFDLRDVNRYNLNLGSFYDLEIYQRILARTETENAIISTTKRILYPLSVLFR
jgi:hypothetical protein